MKHWILNVEDVTDVDYAYAKRVCKDFEIKNLGQHHDLHVQSDTLLLADVFENFRNMCLKMYKLDPVAIEMKKEKKKKRYLSINLSIYDFQCKN